jgi:hypothetical protein
VWNQLGRTRLPADRERERAIFKQIETHLGPIDYVFHEKISESVHVDVHRVPPQKQRPFYTSVTSGMSERQMTVPDGAESLRLAELILCLPPNWPLSLHDFRDEQNYWPIRLLKILARLPLEFCTWLGLSQSVPHGDLPRPYAANTRFCCSILVPPLTCPDPFRTLVLTPEQTIHFYAVLPLFPEELDCKLTNRMNVLIDQLDRFRVTELVNIRRKNTREPYWFGH